MVSLALALIFAIPARAVVRRSTTDRAAPPAAGARHEPETLNLRDERLENALGEPRALEPLGELSLHSAQGQPLDVHAAALRGLRGDGEGPADGVPSRGLQVEIADKLSALFDGLGPFNEEERLLINDAVFVSFLAHRDDFRELNVEPMPYLRHIGGAVRTLVEEFKVRDARTVAVMLLHDVKEDHPTVWDAHKHRFDEQVQRGVGLLDKGHDPEASLKTLMREGTREFILAKLSDRINNLRGVRYNLEEPRDDAGRFEVLLFAQKQFGKTEQMMLPWIERTSLLLEIDRKIFYHLVLAEVHRIQESEPEASFLESLKKRLSTLLAP